ncbi:MAG TPA: hypothetical protein VNW97_07470 [Candidatus Saccharimonadales bacterium]|jgi:hypothetical protein|nr:hypothetical protein [Candidatus Saccharimonadales bacterium]
MGFAISWLAVRGNTEASVLAALGLEKTGTTEEIPEHDWCSTRLGDWMIVWSNSVEPARFRDAASRLKGEIVICDVEEHVMFAATSAFNEGTLSWRIVHDAQQAQDHLPVEGKPPESFARIRTEQFALVKTDHSVDFIFDVPIRMAEETVGFRHDAELGTLFDILRTTSAPKPRWKFW